MHESQYHLLRTRRFLPLFVTLFLGAGNDNLFKNAIAVLVHEKTELEFSLIPPGEFLMGSPETEEGRSEWEGPRHSVSFSRPFLISRTECTLGAWYPGAIFTAVCFALVVAPPINSGFVIPSRFISLAT